MIKLLILGIRMDRGGTERALISFLQGLDPTVFQVDLLLAQQEGPLLPSIPAHVRLLPPMKNGILFTMSRRNAASVFRKLAFIFFLNDAVKFDVILFGGFHRCTSIR